MVLKHFLSSEIWDQTPLGPTVPLNSDTTFQPLTVSDISLTLNVTQFADPDTVPVYSLALVPCDLLAVRPRLRGAVRRALHLAVERVRHPRVGHLGHAWQEFEGGHLNFSSQASPPPAHGTRAPAWART